MDAIEEWIPYLGITNDEAKVYTHLAELYFGENNETKASTIESVMEYTKFARDKVESILTTLIIKNLIIKIKEMFFLSPMSLVNQVMNYE